MGLKRISKADHDDQVIILDQLTKTLELIKIFTIPIQKINSLSVDKQKAETLLNLAVIVTNKKYSSLTKNDFVNFIKFAENFDKDPEVLLDSFVNGMILVGKNVEDKTEEKILKK